MVFSALEQCLGICPHLINLMLVGARFLNVWDSLARLCIPKRYRFDEDAGSDDNTERGRLLLRQEQARTGDLPDDRISNSAAMPPMHAGPHIFLAA